jgi:hypothetical protein
MSARHRDRDGRSFVGALLVLSAIFSMGPVRGAAADLQAGDGFGGLKWGVTVNEALRTYPDLHFKGYRIVREKEEPFRVYTSAHAGSRIDGVAFDALEYWFQGDRYRGIRAVLDSRIGPRTLMTEAELSYGTLMGRIRRIYGKPAEYRVNYVTEDLAVIKEARWKSRGVAIILKYNGAEKGNTDRLTLVIRKHGGAP